MYRYCFCKTMILIGLLLVATVNTSYAGDNQAETVAAALIMQLVTFEKSLMSSDKDMKIHVVGSTALADALKKSVGWQIAKRKLSQVTVSNALPEERPDILCVTDSKIISEVIEYTRKEKIFSLTTDPKLVKKGISLGVSVDNNGKQKIIVNMTASSKEGLDWNPAILKVAKVVK